ncbi:MAG: hypothetical protein M3296_10960 [Actinomycetota bacterium]|nr:hypothetical protein [Actinomycetota bacterium]
MLACRRLLGARLLPCGPLDVVRQVLLFASACFQYRLTRGMIGQPRAATAAPAAWTLAAGMRTSASAAP